MAGDPVDVLRAHVSVACPDVHVGGEHVHVGGELVGVAGDQEGATANHARLVAEIVSRIAGIASRIADVGVVLAVRASGIADVGIRLAVRVIVAWSTPAASDSLPEQADTTRGARRTTPSRCQTMYAPVRRPMIYVTTNGYRCTLMELGWFAVQLPPGARLRAGGSGQCRRSSRP